MDVSSTVTTSSFWSVAILALPLLVGGLPAHAAGPASCQTTDISPLMIKACTSAIDNPDLAKERAVNLAFRGFARMKLDDTQGALADFDSILRSDDIRNWQLRYLSNGDAPDPAFWAAMIHLRRSEVSEALVNLDLAIQRNQSRSFVHAARAEALSMARNFDWAVASQQLAIDLARTHPPSGAEPWNLPSNIESLEAGLKTMLADADRDRIHRLADMPHENRVLADALAKGQTARAVNELEAIVAGNPGNQLALFALGTARVMLAVEHLGQALYRFGLKKSDAPIFEEVMFRRLPVPDNPAPEMLTYEKARNVLRQFNEDLAKAEEPLSRVTDPSIALHLNLGAIALDFNGNGRVDKGEELSGLYSAVSGAGIGAGQASFFGLRLDAADAAWLQGYCHMLAGMSDILLAYDWHQFFDATFFRFFPESGVPNAELANSKNEGAGMDEDAAAIVDAVVFVHMLNWPLEDKARMASARQHFLEVARLSRLSWQRIAAETDNDHEWVPGPKQTGAIAGMAVTDTIVGGWLSFLDQFENILEGRVLLPHWRYEDGLNLRKLFDNPLRLDAVMWVQGPMLKPYLEKGTLATQEDWWRISKLMGGDFFRYALWFN